MNNYQRYDSCYATIKEKCYKGVILLLDNNELAFASNFTTQKVGTKVLCSILKEASEKYRALALIESTDFESLVAA